MSKIPPQSLEAEQAVLASVLMDNDALNVCAEYIKPDDFYKEAHRLIFRSMIELSDKSEPIDLVTIVTYLQNKSILEQVGGSAYLSYLVDGVPVASNVDSYARLVRDKSLVRNLISASTEIVSDCYADPGNVSELIDRAESRLFAVSGQRENKSFAAAKDLVYEGYKLIEKLYERQSHLTGLATGFKDLDEMTGGLQKGDLFIVAGRPSMGKTAFALNMAVNAARFNRVVVKDGKRNIESEGEAAPGERVDRPVIAVYSLEMGKEQLMMRMMTSEARIDAGRIRKGELHDDDWPKLTKAADLLSQQKIFIDDQAAQSTFEIRAKARRLAKEHGLDLVIIDYMQLIRGSGNTFSREQEISEISRSLKALAKEMQVPVIALSQLNRSVETRDDKRPRMSDLRESGAIEQDADVISFVYRDVVYNQDTPDKNVAEIILGKHRNGAIGKVRLAFLNEFTRFEDLVFDAYGAPPESGGYGPGQDDGPF